MDFIFDSNSAFMNISLDKETDAEYGEKNRTRSTPGIDKILSDLGVWLINKDLSKETGVKNLLDGSSLMAENRTVRGFGVGSHLIEIDLRRLKNFNMEIYI